VGPYRIVSRYVPAEEAQVLAGDFYGVIREPSGSVAVMVGDVAGHGPGAAAVATRLRASWRGLASAGVPARDAAHVLNETMIAERRRASLPVLFATLCLASIEPDGSKACFVLAGHPPPILVAAGGIEEYVLATDPAIGITDDPEWTVHDVGLPAVPWSLVFYTDGLVEGRAAPDGPRPFGTARLHELHGEHDLSTVAASHDRLAPIADRGEAAIIDLSQVTFIDSAVLTELIASRRGREEGGGARLAIVAPPRGFPARVLAPAPARSGRGRAREPRRGPGLVRARRLAASLSRRRASSPRSRRDRAPEAPTRGRPPPRAGGRGPRGACRRAGRPGPSRPAHGGRP
jgi:ABC-type transporter Mla MlaB component